MNICFLRILDSPIVFDPAFSSGSYKLFFFCSFISNYYSLLGLGRGKGKRMLENTNSDEQKDSYGKNRGIGACQKKLKMGPIISENETDDEESESEQG